MKEELSKEQKDAILKALDETIEKDIWGESNFLKAIGKKLSDIRQVFFDKSNGPLPDEARKTLNLAQRVAMRSGQQEIFISLYSSDGNNLLAWERILMNLPKQMIARPIYASEEDVKSIIKTKLNKVNEAYVSMYINQSDILVLPPDKIHMDKLQKPLLTLKDQSLILENINCFVHTSGIYQYVQGRLVRNQ